jgi:hypothetical protein
LFLTDEEVDVDLSDEVDAESIVETEAGGDSGDLHFCAERSGKGEPVRGKRQADEGPAGRVEEDRSFLEASEKSDIILRGGSEPSRGEQCVHARRSGVGVLVSEDGHVVLTFIEFEVADVDAVERFVERLVEEVVHGRAENTTLNGLLDSAVDGVLKISPNVESEELQNGQDSIPEPAAVAVDLNRGAAAPVSLGRRGDVDGLGVGVQAEIHCSGNGDSVCDDTDGTTTGEQGDVEAASAEARAELDLPTNMPVS